MVFDVISGKERIRAYFKGMFDQFNSSGEFYGEVEMEVDNNLAISRANGLVSIMPKEGDQTNLLDLKVVDICKRQTDGARKIYRMMIPYQQIVDVLNRCKDQYIKTLGSICRYRNF